MVHKEKANMVKSTRGWKHGVIFDVSMLQRAAMFKPDVARLYVAEGVSL